VPDIGAGLVEIGAAQPENALPYYMAVGRTLKRAVKKGAVITFADVTPPEESALWTLREEQDAAFATAVAMA
jgi:predicted homoserine dehydrogenase-like protein